jgi:histone H3/H4
MFEQGIRNVCEESKCILKREAVVYTQLFTEYLITKLIEHAYLIAKNAKRNRISGKDILLAYKLALF